MKLNLLFFTLLCVASAWVVEDNFFVNLQKKLNDFNVGNPYEELHVTFNQEKYAVGDTIFFCASLFNSDLKPAHGKKILTIGLFDSNGTLTQKINFSLTEGYANNQIAIKSSLVEGIYNVIVYLPNNHASNSILFQKEILIVSKYKLKAIPIKSTSVSFFYEGGRFIHNIPNKIVIRSNFGKLGKIVSDKSAEITRFSLNHDGMAVITFTPQLVENYYAEIEGVGKFPLKAIENDGCALSMIPTSDNFKSFQISFPANSSFLSQEFYNVIVANRRKLVHTSSVSLDLNSTTLNVRIPNKDLPNGINEIAIFDKDGSLLASRIFHNENRTIVAEVSPSKKSYFQREKIDLSIALHDNGGKPVQGLFSISVVQDNLLNQYNSWGNLENALPSTLFEEIKRDLSSTVLTNEALNDYLITKSWLGLPWETILANNTTYKNSPAQSNLSLTGRAYFKKSMTPVPDSTTIFGYLQNAMIGYETYTTNDGSFQMPFLFDFWGEDVVFYLMESKGKEFSEEYIIIQQESIPKVNPTSKSSLTDSIDVYADYATKHNMVNQSYKFYSSEKTDLMSHESLNAYFENKAMGADFTLNLQDYIVFPTMKDLIREVIPFFEHRKKGDKDFIRLKLNKKTGYIKAKSDPLVIIDGVMIKNKDLFLNLSPANITTIKIVNDLNKLSQWGELGKNGIVLIETKKKLTQYISKNSTVVNVTGLSKPYTFHSPDHARASKIPDLRSALYWNPRVVTNASGIAFDSFYTSDDLGEMNVIVKGFTNEGEDFQTSIKFEVIKQKNK